MKKRTGGGMPSLEEILLEIIVGGGTSVTKLMEGN